MKCPDCQTEVAQADKFCRECGKKLDIECSQCGRLNVAGSKFCAECGHNLTLPSGPPPKDLSFEEKIAKIQRYLPEGLTEKILSQRDRIEGERKQVTVMFCDLEGFTALTERLGPEEAYSIMDQVYEILIHKVHDYEGTVNEMTGDGIVALFGAPIALEGAPQRAIRSAMAIHREMTRFSDRMSKEKAGIRSLKMRIGIHSGPVVVGTLGNDLRVEFKAVGDTVNLASRMEELARPGTTCVTEETFKLTEGLFRYEALGAQEIKGKDESVNVYQVIAPSTRRTRFDVSAERGLTPFVGRERELELLLDGYERAKSGRGQAFSIIAEAGIGKSRLLYEFRKMLVNEDVTFLEGRCLSYSKGVAYHPVTDILKGNFDVQEGDTDLEIREKVRNGLEILGADEVSTLPYLLELLSVKDSGIDKIPISHEARRDRIIEALKRIALLGSKIRPLIMAFEDLYWVDKSSEEALKLLLESIPGLRVLLIFTYRPEYVHTWGAKTFHSQVTLNRLSNRESLAMVTHLLGTEDIASDLGELILEKAEGVPLFIEEFIKSLEDLKIIERREDRCHLAKDIQHVTIPSTIQDVIMARVDTLPVGTRELLQTASVIERQFSYQLIMRLTDLPEQDLLKHLSVLKDSEILFERGIYPETDYIFKHALTQEVVYDSILTGRKKKLHEKIGTCIEQMYEKNLAEYYGLLSHHFIESGDYEKGADYSKRTARKFEKSASLNDAIAYAEKRIACLERLPQTEDSSSRLIDARTALGLYHLQMHRHGDAKQAVDPIVGLAIEKNYRKRLSQIYSILGAYRSVEEDIQGALEDLKRALKISEEMGDAVSVVFANLWLGVTFSWNCEFSKANEFLEKALKVNLAADSLVGISVMKSCLSYFVYFYQGRIELGYKTTAEAIRLAEESGDIYSKLHAYIAYGVICYGKGALEDAKTYLTKGADLCERLDAPVWNTMSRLFLAEVYYEMNEYEESQLSYERASALSSQHGHLPSMGSFCRIGSIRARVLNSGEEADLHMIYDFVNQNRWKLADGWIRRYLVEILLATDENRISEAENWIKESIEADRTNGMMLSLGRDQALSAVVCKHKGDLFRAKEALKRAIEIFNECGADGWVEEAEKELASLS